MGVWEDNLHVNYVLHTLTQTAKQLLRHVSGVKRVNMQVRREQEYVRIACLAHTVKGDGICAQPQVVKLVVQAPFHLKVQLYVQNVQRESI